MLLTLIAIAAMAGCASSHEQPRIMRAPAFYVPTTAIAQARTNSYDVLPGSDSDLYIPRIEKFAYGSSNSAATIFIYDVQNISIRHSGSSGYRYRWLVEQDGSYVPGP
jgi:hypothetical protein